MRVTIPIIAAKNGGNLYALIDDLTNTNSAVSNTPQGTNVILDDGKANNKIGMDQALLLSILAEGGEIEHELMAIKMPTSLGTTTVPDGVPYRDNVIGGARKFSEWFFWGAEVWIDNTNNQIVFYSNPLGAIADKSQYLKGSEMELIRQLDTVNISILNLEEARAEVEDATKNYVKVVWA